MCTARAGGAALRCRKAAAKTTRLIFGGRNLLVKIKMGKSAPARVVNCRWLGELKGISLLADSVEIGAGTPLRQIEMDPHVERECPALVDAILSIAGPAIRNMGTLGGNVANASPAADAAVALLAHRARFRLKSRGGERTVDAQSFFLGPGKTVLAPGEILTHVILPRTRDGRVAGRFRKVGRVAGDIAKLSAAVTAVRRGSGALSWQVAMGSVAPRPVLLADVAAILEQAGRFDDEVWEAVRSQVSESITPIDDMRSTAWYRKRVSAVTVADLCRTVFDDLRGAGHGS